MASPKTTILDSQKILSDRSSDGTPPKRDLLDPPFQDQMWHEGRGKAP
jgi:hypothetical protein